MAHSEADVGLAWRCDLHPRGSSLDARILPRQPRSLDRRVDGAALRCVLPRGRPASARLLCSPPGTNGGMQPCCSLLVMLESQLHIHFGVRDLIVFVCHCRGVAWWTEPPPQPPSPSSLPPDSDRVCLPPGAALPSVLSRCLGSLCYMICCWRTAPASARLPRSR